MMSRKNSVGDGDSAAQKRTLGALPDTVCATKKSSTPVASDATTEKGAADKNKATTNRNWVQGKESDVVCTVTSYFDPVWNVFSKHTDGSIQWIPKQIVAIGEDSRCPASGGGIERVFFSAGKQYDALKKSTMDKTLENTLKVSINTMLLTCDDKGVFTDDDDTYRKHK